MARQYRKEWWLFLTCDGCGERGEFRGLDQPQAAGFARHKGWAIGKNDRCQKCKTKPIAQGGLAPQPKPVPS